LTIAPIGCNIQTVSATQTPRLGTQGLEIKMTTFTQYSVNAQGKKEIREFLASHHKLGGDHFTDSMIAAWAADAEFQLTEGNPAMIEIRSFDAVSGHTETFTISDAGMDAEQIKIE
jgi:hypothetical protein